MNKSTITVYKLPVVLHDINNETNWYVDRQEAFTNQIELDTKNVSLDTLRLILNDKEQFLVSIGDIVKIETYPRNNSSMPEYFLYKSTGWEKYKSGVIQLIRHLLW